MLPSLITFCIICRKKLKHMRQIHLPFQKIYQLKVHQLVFWEVKNIVVVSEEWDWDLALLKCLDIIGIFILGHPHLVLLIRNCKIRLLNIHFHVQQYDVVCFGLSCQGCKCCCVEYYWTLLMLQLCRFGLFSISRSKKCSIIFVDRLSVL